MQITFFLLLMYSLDGGDVMITALTILFQIKSDPLMFNRSIFG
jgi:hypothetical protein